MPHAVKSRKPAAKKEISYQEEEGMSLVFTLKGVRLPPGHPNGIRVFEPDKPKDHFPGKQYKELADVTEALSPSGSDVIDHLHFLPSQNNQTKFRLYLKKSLRDGRTRLRIETLLITNGYAPRPGI